MTKDEGGRVGAGWTPGPWRVEGPANFPNPNMGMWQVEGATNVCTHCTLRDAHLISAALDMRAALKLALEYWAHRQRRYKNRSPVWVQDARAALSKATAESEARP